MKFLLDFLKPPEHIFASMRQRSLDIVLARVAMAVTIEKTSFGSSTIDGEVYPHDVIVRLSEKIQKRKKKLSKRV